MIIYGSSLSPFVKKVMVVALEKGVAFERRGGGLGQGDAAFAEASPFGKIPALRDPGADDGRDFVLADSTAICAYIEAKHPMPVLIPAAPIARARVTWFDEFADTVLQPVAAKLFYHRLVAPRLLKRAFDESIAAAAEATELPPVIDYLERMAPEDGFLVGDAFTLADIAVASTIASLSHIGWGIDAARWPKAHGWAAAMLARASFAEVLAGERAFLAGLPAY